MKISLVLILLFYTLDNPMLYLQSKFSLKDSPNLNYGVLCLESKKDRQFDFNLIDPFTGRNVIDYHKIRNIRRKREKGGHVNLLGELQEPIIFEDKKKMIKVGDDLKTGAIAYVKNEDTFFGKSSRGWLPFQMGSPVTTTTATTTTTTITTTTTERPVEEPIIPKSVTKAILETEIIKQMMPQDYMKMHPVYQEPVKKLRLISANRPHTGNMGGINNANFKCQKEAEASGIDGVYRAFLESNDTVLATLLGPDKFVSHQIVNLNGETLFKSFQELLDKRGRFSYENNTVPRIYSFKQKDVFFNYDWEVNAVWHGAQETKNSTNVTRCNDWTSESVNHTGIASDVLFHGLLHKSLEPCNEKLILLCIETGEKRDLDSLNYGRYVATLQELKNSIHPPEDESNGNSSAEESNTDGTTTENKSDITDSNSNYKDDI